MKWFTYGIQLLVILITAQTIWAYYHPGSKAPLDLGLTAIFLLVCYTLDKIHIALLNYRIEKAGLE